MATPSLYPITGSTVAPDSEPGVELTTSMAAIVTAGANDALDVKTIILTNLGSTDRTVEIEIYRSSVSKTIFKKVTVPADDSAIPVGRDNPIYLLAGDQLRMSASANSAVNASVFSERVTGA